MSLADIAVVGLTRDQAVIVRFMLRGVGDDERLLHRRMTNWGDRWQSVKARVESNLANRDKALWQLEAACEQEADVDGRETYRQET
jgi:hypothetical protein